MSLLSVCQDVAGDIPVRKPTSIVGNTNPTASLLYGYAVRTAEEIRRAKLWVCCIREHSFATAIGTADYALPSDFDQIHDLTAWDRTTFYDLRGPLGPAEWQVYKSSLLQGSVTLAPRYRLKFDVASVKKRLFLDPTPGAVENIVYEYSSRNAIVNGAGDTFLSRFAADTDVFLPDEHLLRLGL